MIEAIEFINEAERKGNKVVKESWTSNLIQFKR